MKDHTTIAVVLDNSGSMWNKVGDTIGGFNTFLKTQKETPGSADISLYKFGSNYNEVYSAKDVREAEDLTDQTYRANGGSTALYDAIGKTITSVGDRLRDMPEDDRPNKVVLVIITDGEENSSREYNHKQIQAMIKCQQDTYSWEIMYLGSTLNAVEIGTSMGIKGGSAAHYSEEKTSAVFNTLGSKMSMYRSLAPAAREAYTKGDVNMFDDEDRKVLS